ncbi:MAG: polysaccharide deacetylase family protein [Ilumatobacteraceae bacterium]
MKAVMYHYVREFDDALPNFTYLRREDFVQQLEYLREEFGFCRKHEFLGWITDPETYVKPTGVVLTFDDGFADHYHIVQPILSDFKTWGVFYVPTGIFTSSKLLDVHRIHLLLGLLGGRRCMEMLRQCSSSDMFPDVLKHEFKSDTYLLQQTSDEMTKEFKRMMNYFIDYEWRASLIDQLFKNIKDLNAATELERDFYLTPRMIGELHNAGNLIGSHSVTHRVMSKLSEDEQRLEIRVSLSALADFTGHAVETFSYPFGGFHTFTSATEDILEEEGVKFSFNVEQRDISVSDAKFRPQALPRYDCNQFLHGKASTGTNGRS